MVADIDAKLMHVELKYFSESITTGILHCFSLKTQILEILVVV